MTDKDVHDVQGDPMGDGALAELWSRRRPLAVVFAATFAISLALALTVGARFEARAKLAPIGRDPTGSRLGVIASQFASLAGGAGIVESVEYYAELLRSRDLLASVVAEPIAPPAPGQKDSTTLLDLWHPAGATKTERTRVAAKRLGAMISVVTSRDANVVTLIVTTKDPELSSAICSRIVGAVNDFNLTKRRGRATAERVFTETRLGEVTRALHTAEEAVRAFAERNRAPILSPQLRLEAQRLQRDVELQQTLYLSLSQALEQAKIDEVRDTPVVTIIEGPSYTVARETQPLLVALALSLAITGAAAAWSISRNSGAL